MAANNRFAILTAPWMLLSILTLFLWGAWGLESKLIVDRISPWLNQVVFAVGLIPLVGAVLFTKNFRRVNGNRNIGSMHALLTGILGGTGNLALYVALARNGKVSVVVPLIGLAPLITVLLARFWLNETLNWLQWMGVALALVSIYLLSV